jgi:ribonuclease D
MADSRARIVRARRVGNRAGRRGAPGGGEVAESNGDERHRDDAPDWSWVDDPPGVEALAGELAGVSPIALDCEANAFHVYRPRLCLLQLAWNDPAGGPPRVALVDPLATPLGRLAALLESARIDKTLHGGDYDVRLLRRDRNIALAGLFDTEISARLLGMPKTGLAALAAEIVGVSLDKSTQRIDWAQRPLPPRALAYAAQDVRVLLPIRREMERRLVAAGRRHWAEEEFRALETVQATPEGPVDVAQLLRRVSGAGRLNPRQRAVLAELLRWREEEARERDRPAVHIAPTAALLAAAKEQPRTVGALIRGGLSPRIARREGPALLAALERGLAAPPVPRERGQRPPVAEPPEVAARLPLLREARSRRAAALGLDPGSLCSVALLKEAARAGPRAPADLRVLGLRDWQVEACGEALLDALAQEPDGRA